MRIVDKSKMDGAAALFRLIDSTDLDTYARGAPTLKTNDETDPKSSSPRTALLGPWELHDKMLIWEENCEQEEDEKASGK